jgi:hypothetical protein
MDIYPVFCGSPSGQPRVFMDMNHNGYIEDLPIPGFTMTSPPTRAGCITDSRGISRVSGAVYGSSMPFLIPEVKLTFASDQSCAEVVTGDSGRYAISLPPGVYIVEAFRTGFCKGEIARVVVSGASDVRFSVTLAASNVFQGDDPIPPCPVVRKLCC